MCWAVFFLASVAFFLLLVMIPVWTTPGHDFLFQIELLGAWGTALVAVLSLANGLLIAMQIAIHRKTKEAKSLAKRATEATTLGGIIVSSLAATIACAACYSSLLAFAGLGATAFLVEHRTLFAILALAITFAALYYSAKRLNNACAVCSINKPA